MPELATPFHLATLLRGAKSSNLIAWTPKGDAGGSCAAPGWRGASMQGKAIYPGSFDVLTLGHLDIIRRGAAMHHHLVVGVANNPHKTPVFSRTERVAMLREATSHLKNVTVGEYDGLTVDFAQQNDAQVILRGLRFVSDFEFELQFAMANSQLAPGIETIFIAPSPQFSFVSSSMVKQMAAHRRDVSGFVPPVVATALAVRFGPPLHIGEAPQPGALAKVPRESPWAPGQFE